ncbi:MAG: DNA-binding response regulator [Chitinivibrionales bacterium]|nr:DNA-binding response regulator [Chitinivibrionales bacterium]
MGAIRIAVLDAHSQLLLDGLAALLDRHDDFEVVGACTKEAELTRLLKSRAVSIVVMVWHGTDVGRFGYVERLRCDYPRIGLAIVCMDFSEALVQRAIKAGVQGILTHGAGEQELVQAVYTLRGGHDYLEESISRLLLKDYVDSLRTRMSPSEGPLSKLSRREIEVLGLWGDGRSNMEIADTLFISVRTVESHKNHIMQKLNLRTTVDLMKFAIRNGITSL